MSNLKEALEKLPQAYPFRMIDRILEIEPGKKATVLKNVSMDEPFMKGHFPRRPLMPGFLMLEVLAQAGGLAFQSSFDQAGDGAAPFLAKVDEFRLKRDVVPGDQVLLEAEVIHVFGDLAKVRVRARVGDEEAAEGVLVLGKKREGVQGKEEGE